VPPPEIARPGATTRRPGVGQPQSWPFLGAGGCRRRRGRRLGRPRLAWWGCGVKLWDPQIRQRPGIFRRRSRGSGLGV